MITREYIFFLSLLLSFSLLLSSLSFTQSKDLKMGESWERITRCTIWWRGWKDYERMKWEKRGLTGEEKLKRGFDSLVASSFLLSLSLSFLSLSLPLIFLPFFENGCVNYWIIKRYQFIAFSLFINSLSPSFNS